MSAESKKASNARLHAKHFADDVLQIHEVAHHRNGVGGEPFHVVTFTDPAEPGRNFVGVVFQTGDREGYGRWAGVAVFDRDLLGQGIIDFGVNSWRGDNYAERLRTAIAERVL